MTERVPYVSDDSFPEESVPTTEPILLDFTADWCEPCKAMDPTIEAIAKEFEGRLRVLKVDLDESPELVSRFRVMSIPTLVLLRGGESVQRLRGPRSHGQLAKELEDFLSASS